MKHSKDKAYIYFTNKVWEVSAQGINEIKIDSPINTEKSITNRINSQYRLGKRVMIDDDFQINEPVIKIRKSEDNKYFIGLKDNASDFAKFLVAICPTNAYSESCQFFEANFYAFGYLMHQYNDFRRPWTVCVMNHNKDAYANGKSLFIKAASLFHETVTIDGNDRKLFENKFLVESVTTDTTLINYDDFYSGFSFVPLIVLHSHDLRINKKNQSPFTIPFADAPKVCLTVNTDYQSFVTMPSIKRRVLPVILGDYFSENHSPKDEFNKILFIDWTAKEWNDFVNIAAQALQYYLSK